MNPDDQVDDVDDELDPGIEGYWAAHTAGNMQGMLIGGALVAVAGLCWGPPAVVLVELAVVALYLVARAGTARRWGEEPIDEVMRALPISLVVVAVVIGLYLRANG